MSNDSNIELTSPHDGHEQAKAHSPALREDIGATSSEYESRQTYIHGLRLHLITGW